MKQFEVIVVGGGHAGVEAALAAARLGCRTALFTMSFDQIGNLPCNPSIGGPAKSHLVFEIDALGGEMAKAADATTLQKRTLNRSKGPAVHSLRAQIDRQRYHEYIKRVLEQEPLLSLKQDEVIQVRIENGKTVGVVGKTGGIYSAKKVVLCCGTYLNGTIFVGETSYQGGPDGSLAATFLTDQLKEIGFSFRRFKTGTPPRVARRSIDFSKLQKQPGEDQICSFSFQTTQAPDNRVNCYIAYTNENTHQVIRDHLKESPLYSGKIVGVGPRYCPSIEDKVVRFSDKPRHQTFVEPMGEHTQEMYLQGLSSSLPEDVQQSFLQTIDGFEQIEIMRSGYAIEYDCWDPLQLYPTLETKRIKGLYGAGQFNGTSGYEEAAAQGLIAGINAALSCNQKEPLILDRASSYIGALIDDLVTRGCNEPYRMMTSRSEFRLLLRQDNADSRLMPIGRKIGLLPEEVYREMTARQQQIEKEQLRLRQTSVYPTEEVNQFLVSRGTSPIEQKTSLEQLLRRPQLSYLELAPLDCKRPLLERRVTEQVEIILKYEGYIQKQQKKVLQMRKMEKKRLPDEICYHKIEGLRLEAREKLDQMRPLNIGQASRISGVSPSDVAVLLIYLEQKKRKEKKL